VPGGLQARDTTFFLAKDNEWNSSEHRERMAELGIPAATVYYKLTSEDNRKNPYAWIRDNYLDNSHPTVVTLIIDNGSSTVGTSEGTDVSAGVPGLLQQVLRGDFDDDLKALAKVIAKDGRPVVIRPFHEANGGWYPWGMYAQGNSPEQLVLALQHVVNIFEKVQADNVSFEMNLNRRGGDDVLEEAYRYIPFINKLVDAYSISTYNRCGTSKRYEDELSFSKEFAPVYERLSEMTSHPINLAEVSTSGECAPKMPWFEEMLTDIDERFPRVESITFFFGTVPVGKASNDVEINWGVSGNEAAFKELLQKYRLRWEESMVVPSKGSVVQSATVIRPVTRPVTRRDQVHSQPAIRAVTRKVVRPIIRPATTPAQVQSQLSHNSQNWIWEAWADLRTTIGDEPIPGYGTAGTVGQTSLRFSYLGGGAVQSGPSFLLGGVLSDECGDRYWQCQMRAEASYLWRWRPSELGDYNRLQFGLGAGYRYYGDFGGRPERLDDGDFYGFVGLTWTAGGEFK
jgi:hypothetical protein